MIVRGRLWEYEQSISFAKFPFIFFQNAMQTLTMAQTSKSKAILSKPLRRRKLEVIGKDDSSMDIPVDDSVSLM